MPARVVPGRPDAGVVLTCEHASHRLPPPWSWPEADAWVRTTHWAWDPGAAEITEALARAWNVPAVLAQFTRLLADPNRPPDHGDLFRTLADGRDIALNQEIPRDDAQARMALHRGYHDTVDRVVAAHPRALVLSIHSFTAVYQGGSPREMEVGVLFDRDESLAREVHDRLAHAGWRVALNEPYSGRAGLMYAPDRHARAHGRRALEFEIRQDISTDPTRHAALVEAIMDAINPCLPRGSS